MSHEKTGIIIATLFLARDLAHREHLATNGIGADARHRSLGEFYEEIVELGDDLAESYMGRFNVDLDIPLLASGVGEDIIAVLEAQADWIHATRYEAVAREETALNNIVDDIELRYYRTLFKLRRLK
jgi:hypothetical protein